LIYPKPVIQETLIDVPGIIVQFSQTPKISISKKKVPNASILKVSPHFAYEFAVTPSQMADRLVEYIDHLNYSAGFVRL